MMMTADQDRHITERLLRLPTTSNWMNVLLLRLIDTHIHPAEITLHLLTTTIPLLGGAKRMD